MKEFNATQGGQVESGKFGDWETFYNGLDCVNFLQIKA